MKQGCPETGHRGTDRNESKKANGICYVAKIAQTTLPVCGETPPTFYRTNFVRSYIPKMEHRPLNETLHRLQTGAGATASERYRPPANGGERKRNKQKKRTKAKQSKMKQTKPNPYLTNEYFGVIICIEREERGECMM